MRTPTLYVSRRVRIPSLAAPVVFDQVCSAQPLAAPGAAMTCREAPFLAGPDLPLRTVVGRLRAVPGRSSFAVEVELTPWSRLEPAIGIRPLGRRVPLDDGRTQRRYIGLAFALVDHLAAELECAFAAWERDAVVEAMAALGTTVGT
jgi:hypothetical protein